ncbi:MAG: glycosyltransferase family 39 protein [Myxococcota bacterium]|nr:glycosyltransferase family 39 protein [Myxococcota bacterium]
MSYLDSIQIWLAALFCVLSSSPQAYGHAIDGWVKGGAETESVTVMGTVSRNLHRGEHIVAATGAVGLDGSFHLEWSDGPSSVWLFVVRAPADSPPSALIRAPRVMASHAPVAAEQSAVVLQVPSNKLTQTVWSGDTLTHRGQQAAGVVLLFALSLLALWLRRRSDIAAQSPTLVYSPRMGALWCGVSLVILLAGLGNESLDLLEYSYFHEGVRPPTAMNVVSDSISAELAHGPVMPLILRAMSAISPTPEVLRFPSAVFGALFVWCVFSIMYQRLGSAAGHLSALLALGSPIAWFYARDATPYALTGYLAAASVWLVIRASESQRPAVWWVLFSMVQLLGFYSHYGYAFFSIAMGLTLLLTWWKDRPRSLSYALVAFVAAGVLPVLNANTLFTMIQSSGARFALMSPVYPDSPGLGAFIAQFLTVLTGLPEWMRFALFATLPLWSLGFHRLWRSDKVLGWFSILQVVLLVSWLMFSHTMSVEFGGGKVFYAYRWTRPLLLGVIFPFAALGTSRYLRWVGLVLGVMTLIQAWVNDAAGRRPAIGAAVEQLASKAETGDAWGVLPAAFYGDPVLYALHDGTPPSYITQMHTFDTDLDGRLIRGPIVEAHQPFETAIDRLEFKRVWIFEFAEAMFGTPKFDPLVARRTRQALEVEGWSEIEQHRYGYLTLSLFECRLECQWLDQSKLAFHLDDRLGAERYIQHPAGSMFAPLSQSEITLVLPSGTKKLEVHWSDSSTGVVSVLDQSCDETGQQLSCAFHDDTAMRPTTKLQFSEGMLPSDVWIEVSR